MRFVLLSNILFKVNPDSKIVSWPKTKHFGQLGSDDLRHFSWTGLEPASGLNRKAKRSTTTTTTTPTTRSPSATGRTSSRTRPNGGRRTRSRWTTLPRPWTRRWRERAGNAPTESLTIPDFWTTQRRPTFEIWTQKDLFLSLSWSQEFCLRLNGKKLE